MPKIFINGESVDIGGIPGADATINGENTIEIVAGENVNIDQQDGTLTISATGGNPIGTIISFMGTSAPTGYLVCDGATYNISAYSELATFFAEQFGSKNYFGGNGTTTFAVPDMRNLFLRGYHGSATEQLSGEIGKKQEATVIPHISTGANSNDIGFFPMVGKQTAFRKVENEDKVVNTTSSFGNGVISSIGSSTAASGSISSYTSRPVNMAVLYCIKVV